VPRQIVVAFRMPPGGRSPGPEGTLLARARALCAQGEALGARMVAWSGAGLALAWDADSMEEAISMATSIREEAAATERAWACGIAEGELEPFAVDGQRLHLASGPALWTATSLARVARAGEALVDGDARAVRSGQLSLIGVRTATDAGERVRGWRLDVERPWRRGVLGASSAAPDATDRFVSFLPEEHDVRGLRAEDVLDAAATQPLPAIRFAEESGTRPWDDTAGDVRSLVDAASDPSGPPPSPLVERVRRLAHGEAGAAPADALLEARRARAVASAGPPAAQCQAALALAMTLSIAQRSDEALLEALDALARAREAGDAKAVAACMALLAKLYAAAGRSDEAAALLKG
jgi:hypothetical protein